MSLDDAWAEGEANCTVDADIFITVELRHPGFVDDEANLVRPRYVLDVMARRLGIEADAAFDAGETVEFLPAAFECERPEQAQGKAPTARMRIDDVTGELAAYLDKATAYRADLTVIVRGYRSDYPAAPSYGPLELALTDITVDSTGVEGTATIADFGDRKVPSRVYRIEDFPGLVP